MGHWRCVKSNFEVPYSKLSVSSYDFIITIPKHFKIGCICSSNTDFHIFTIKKYPLPFSQDLPFYIFKNIFCNSFFCFNFYPRPADIYVTVRPSVRRSVGPSVPKKWNSNFSALVIDRDLGFSRGHQSDQTKPNQTIPNHTIPYHTIPNHTKPRVSQLWD